MFYTEIFDHQKVDHHNTGIVPDRRWHDSLSMHCIDHVIMFSLWWEAIGEVYGDNLISGEIKFKSWINVSTTGTDFNLFIIIN